MALTPTITIGTERYVVIGIVEESNRFPLLAGQVLLGEEQAARHSAAVSNQLAVVTRSGAAAQVGKYAALKIDAYHPERYRVSVPVDPQSLRQEVEGGVQTALYAFTGLAGLVAMVTLANAIATSVMSRRGELGLRRAVGARGKHLAGLVCLEASLVGLAGGVAGLFTGILALLAFTVSQRWLPVFDLRLAPLAVLAGLLFATVSSFIGASRAARISPVTALRSS